MHATTVVNYAGWYNDTNDGSFLDQDMSSGDLVSYRLREGIERFFITDINNPAASAVAQSDVWVMFDEIAQADSASGVMFNHIPGGCNVLYMDGHVEFIRYPGKFPVTTLMARFLGPQAYAGGYIPR